MNYQKGSYFGELALLKDQPRAANVKAKTDVKLLSLDKNSFKRVMGPIDEILKRNAEKYKKFVSQEFVFLTLCKKEMNVLKYYYINIKYLTLNSLKFQKYIKLIFQIIKNNIQIL